MGMGKEEGTDFQDIHSSVHRTSATIACYEVPSSHCFYL